MRITHKHCVSRAARELAAGGARPPAACSASHLGGRGGAAPRRALEPCRRRRSGAPRRASIVAAPTLRARHRKARWHAGKQPKRTASGAATAPTFADRAWSCSGSSKSDVADLCACACGRGASAPTPARERRRRTADTLERPRLMRGEHPAMRGASRRGAKAAAAGRASDKRRPAPRPISGERACARCAPSTCHAPAPPRAGSL